VRDIIDKFGLDPYPLVLCHYQFVAGQYNVQLSLIVTPANAGLCQFVFICLLLERNLFCAFAYSWHLVAQLQN